MMTLTNSCAVLATALIMTAAHAEGVETSASMPVVARTASNAPPEAAKAAPASRDSRPAPFTGAPLTPAALAAKRGGDRALNDTQLTGSVTGNEAVNVSTGANAIGGGAFAGASGITTVIQNTGNNVLIQTSTVVNLQLK